MLISRNILNASVIIYMQETTASTILVHVISHVRIAGAHRITSVLFVYLMLSSLQTVGVSVQMVGLLLGGKVKNRPQLPTLQVSCKLPVTSTLEIVMDTVMIA
jgi:hypothetical protein